MDFIILVIYNDGAYNPNMGMYLCTCDDSKHTVRGGGGGGRRRSYCCSSIQY
jgi:hypothetical protein